MNDVQKPASQSEAASFPTKSTELVNAYNERTGRFDFVEVTWKRYIELWDRIGLKFQQEGTERPEHLPDRETAARWAGIKASPPSPRSKDVGWGRSFADKLQPSPRPQPAKIEEYEDSAPDDSAESELENQTDSPIRSEGETDQPLVLQEATDAVSQGEMLPVLFEKKRRKPFGKLKALKQASDELRKERGQLLASDLIRAAARKLRMTSTGLSRFYYSAVPQKAKERLLYGKGGRKVTRSDIKFGILMQVRQHMRENNKPAPTKMQLADTAVGPLGMTRDSARTYVYDRLTKEQAQSLEFRPPPKEVALRPRDVVTVLMWFRQQMRDRGMPAPRRLDLAKAAAPLLQQKVSSVMTLLGRLSEEDRDKLDFLGSRSRMLVGLEPATIREGFIGGIAVLKLRKLPATASNLRVVLRLKMEVIDSYLAENLAIKALLDKEPDG